jgi:hypothetical protein
MTLIDAKWQHGEQFHWYGVQFDISIQNLRNGTFQSAWVCSVCGEEGVLAPVGRTVADVIRLSQISARVHHQLVHATNGHLSESVS